MGIPCLLIHGYYISLSLIQFILSDTVGSIPKLPGELNMAASSRPGRDRRPRTATTINHVGQGDLKGVKYTKIHVNVYLFFHESNLGRFFQFTVYSLRNNPLLDVCRPPDKVTSPLLDTLGLLKVNL